MNVLYVDVDNTLIAETKKKWTDEDLGFAWGDERPEVFVVAAVQWHHALHGHARHTVIWSGGGEDYADRWRRLLFPGFPFSAMAKDKDVLTAGDIIVDDGIEFKVPKGAFLYLPAEFVERMDDQ